MDSLLAVLAEQFWPGTYPSGASVPWAASPGDRRYKYGRCAGVCSSGRTEPGAFREPLVATSANLTGQPAAVSLDDVLKSGLEGWTVRQMGLGRRWREHSCRSRSR